MFQTIAIILILLALGAAALHWILFPCSREPRISVRHMTRTGIHVCTTLLLPANLNLVGRLRKLVYLVALFAFLVLFLTGFGPRLLTGHYLDGYLLMIHATFAPVFAVCVALAVLGYAQQCTFGREEWQWLGRLFTLRWGGLLENASVGWKATFWIGAFLVLPVALSMILSMYPLFGTHGQEVAFELHRYAALALTLVAIFHVYLSMRFRCKTDLMAE